jgi:hypothetical protein
MRGQDTANAALFSARLRVLILESEWQVYILGVVLASHLNLNLFNLPMGAPDLDDDGVDNKCRSMYGTDASLRLRAQHA